MYACPDCGSDVQERETKCPSCDRNLTALATLHELPDALFNKALVALRGNDLTTANNCVCAGLQYRLRDPGLWMLLGHVAIRLNAIEMSKNCFQMVQLMQREYEPAQHALGVVNQLLAVAQASQTKQSQ